MAKLAIVLGSYPKVEGSNPSSAFYLFIIYNSCFISLVLVELDEEVFMCHR
jgi:hypothetical protein